LAASKGDISSQFAFGFCLEHGLGVEKDDSKSLTYYRKAACDERTEGAFHCGLLLQYGIGTDVDLDGARSFYELLPNPSTITQHSFRCLRSVNKAQSAKVRAQRPKQPKSEAVPLEQSKSVRSLTASQMMSDYLTSPIGSDGGRVIGKGRFSTVTVRRDPATGRLFAVKHIAAPFDRQLLIREVENLVKLNHPCVLRICNWAFPDDRKEGEIHMEFAENGSLANILEKANSDRAPTFWNWTGIGILICGIVLGLRYVHSRGIIHRDLKPSNILVNGKGESLIADFGSSLIVSDDATASGGGTVHYAAPEMYQDEVPCTTKCDVFSFGLVLYEILTRKPVFRPSELPFPVIRRLRIRDLPGLPMEHGRLMQDLIRKCWESDPEKRPSFQEIFTGFKTANFAILPSADRIQIGEFCAAVLEWEGRAGIEI
jgi:hypothetical protein